MQKFAFQIICTNCVWQYFGSSFKRVIFIFLYIFLFVYSHSFHCNLLLIFSKRSCLDEVLRNTSGFRHDMNHVIKKVNTVLYEKVFLHYLKWNFGNLDRASKCPSKRVADFLIGCQSWGRDKTFLESNQEDLSPNRNYDNIIPGKKKVYGLKRARIWQIPGFTGPP